MRAVCQRCGASKPGPLVPCRACGHVPVSHGRAQAWLLSYHHLSPTELAEASRRIRSGERLAPPEELLERARQNMEQAIPGRRRRPKQPSPPVAEEDIAAGQANPQGTEPAWSPEPSLHDLLALDAAGPPGGTLPAWSQWFLAVTCVLLTPLPGWVAWWLWRRSAPQAARQVLRVTLPASLVVLLLWVLFLSLSWSARPG